MELWRSLQVSYHLFAGEFDQNTSPQGDSAPPWVYLLTVLTPLPIVAVHQDVETQA
jgi:hypothetical protein